MTASERRVRDELHRRRTRGGPPLRARLTKVADVDAHEGPVVVDGALWFTAVRRDEVAIRRLDLTTRQVTTLVERSGMANGMALAPDGALLVCEQGSRTRPARVSRMDRATGATQTVADAWDGRPLNSPNDVTVRPGDGSIWFTDPCYGWRQGFRPEPRIGDHVYRVDPATGRVERAADGFDKPNGIAFAPGGDVLYVGDNGAPKELVAFAVAPDGTLADRRVLARFAGEHPDGLKVDGAGRIFASCPDGVRVLAPDGTPIGQIHRPGTVSFAFGAGPLLLTTDTAVWAADLTWEDPT